MLHPYPEAHIQKTCLTIIGQDHAIKYTMDTQVITIPTLVHLSSYSTEPLHIPNKTFCEFWGFFWDYFCHCHFVEHLDILQKLDRPSCEPALDLNSKVVAFDLRKPLVATTTVHRRQYRTNRDSLIPIHTSARLRSPPTLLEFPGVWKSSRPPGWPARLSSTSTESAEMAFLLPAEVS